jgi:pyruvate dehydrogenase E1 component beta subunit
MALITMRQAITDALREEMQRDENVFIMGEEVGIWGGTYAVTRGFYDEFGEKRVRDTPISEMVIGGAAAGAAMNGLRPVAEFMTINFAFLALDAIVNHAAKVHYMFGGNIKCPVVFRAPGGGGRQLGATHSHTPDVIFAHFPGLKVVSPGTPYDAKGLLKSAIRTDDPVFFIEHATLYQVRGEVPEGEDYTVPIGVSDIKREGTDITIVALAWLVHEALAAAEQLAQEGISAEVIDPRTLVPMDVDTIRASVSKTGRLLVADEAGPTAGASAEIATLVCEDPQTFAALRAPVKRVCALQVPIPYTPSLEDHVFPDRNKIAAGVREVMAAG